MEVVLLPKADEDLHYWIQSENTLILRRISILTLAIIENPFKGIGKPEPLKYKLSGKWSRRITEEHRIIYEIKGGKILVFSLRGHY